MNVISGNFNQSDPIIFPKYYGRQCSGNAVAAACKSAVLSPERWVSNTIDECLIAGNNLFTLSFESLPKELYAHQLYLRVDELLRVVSFSDGLEVTYSLNVDDVYDGTSLQNVSTVVHEVGLIDYEINDAVMTILNNYSYIMFTCHSETLAIMKLSNMIYLFDSHQRGKNGLCDSRNGKPVIIKFQCISDLTHHICKLYQCENICQRLSSLGMACSRCAFSMTPLIIERIHDQVPEVISCVSEHCFSQSCSKSSNCDNANEILKLNESSLNTGDKNEKLVSKKISRKEKRKARLDNDPVYKEKERKRLKEKYEMNKEMIVNKRRKMYHENDEYKKAYSSKMREKYQVNEEYKVFHKSYMKEKYRMDEEYGNNLKEIQKVKYRTNEDYRVKKILSVKHDELTIVGKKRKQERNETSNVKRKIKSKEYVESIYKDERRETPSFVCTSCGQLFFKKSVVLEENVQKCLKSPIESVCCYRVHLENENEIAAVCRTCFNALKKGTVPKFSVLNGLIFSRIPFQLRNLSRLEERLVSARLPFMQIREIGYQKQFGLKGNCINVPININKTVTSLPRMDSEDDTVLVQLMRKMSDKKPYLFANVRPEKVFAAAKYLVNTKLYKSHNITLNEEWLEEFDKLKKDSKNVEHEYIENSTENEVEEIDSDDEIISNQDSLLTSGFVADTYVRMAPGEGILPIPLLDDDSDILAFPTVYGGEQRQFKIHYNPVDIAKAEARMHDRRVATNIPKLMMNFCKARAYKLKSKVSIGLRKKVKTDAVTVSQVLNESTLSSMIQHNDGYRIVAVDRASPAYWQSKQKKVMAMLRQFGSATLFLTFTSAETLWIPLLIVLSKTVYNKIITEEEAKNLTSYEKYDLIRKDPITVARYFVNRFNAFRKLMRERNGPLCPYVITEDFYRFEIQFRGSIHVHWLAWIENAPVFDVNDANSFKECEDFIDTFITCKKDESLGDLLNVQYHRCTKTCKKNVKSNEECRFNYPQPPMRKTRILLPLDENLSKDYKKKAKDLYKHIKEKTELIARSDEDCTFDQFLEYLGISEELYIIAIRSILKRPTVFLRRNVNERKINAYNREMLILWEAHMDIQFIVSPYGCVKYVVSYVSKAQKGMSKLLKEVSEQVSLGNEVMCKKLFKVVNAFLNNCEISAQEIALHVLGIPMSRSSIADIYINTVPANERTFMRKPQKELQKLLDEDPNSTNIRAGSDCSPVTLPPLYILFKNIDN